MQAISSYHGNRPTNIHTHKATSRQDWIQYTVPQLVRSVRTVVFSYGLFFCVWFFAFVCGQHVKIKASHVTFCYHYMYHITPIADVWSTGLGFNYWLFAITEVHELSFFHKCVIKNYWVYQIVSIQFSKGLSARIRLFTATNLLAYHLPSELLPSKLFHPSPPFGNNWRHICLGSVLVNIFTTFPTVIMTL